MTAPYNRDRVAWWPRSPGNNDNNAAFVYGDDGNVNDNGNNVKNAFGVRPALPGRPKCMEGSIRRCSGQRNPVPFHIITRGKTHAVGDSGRKCFRDVGNGQGPIPPAADWKNRTKEVKHEKKT